MYSKLPQGLLSDYFYIIPMAILVSFFIVFVTIPTVLKVAFSKRLFDKPDARKCHVKITPRLGGVPIALGFLLTYSFFSDLFEFVKIPFLIPSFVIIFTIGLKDDIVSTAATVKLMGQIIAAVIIVALGGVYITEIPGVLPFLLPEGWGVAICIFAFIFLINGFNLIDGIDGLAAIVGIVTLSSFAIWFFINGCYTIPLLVAALSGGLVAFLYYNMFSCRKKIFMGDTGSLIIGFVVSIVAIEFCKFNNVIVPLDLKYTMNSAPAVAVAVLIVPIVDTIRISCLRICKGLSPFTADKNHIHHRMLAMGMSHHEISYTIGAVNILFVAIAFTLRNIGTIPLLAIVLTLGFLLAALPSWILYCRKRHLIKRFRSIHSK